MNFSSMSKVEKFDFLEGLKGRIIFQIAEKNKKSGTRWKHDFSTFVSVHISKELFTS